MDLTKPILLLVSLLLGTMTVFRVQAQPTGEARAARPMATYQGRSFPRQRTPVEALPVEGQAELLRLETLLQRAYESLTDDPIGPVLPPVLADVLTQAAQQAAAVVPTWNQDAYRQEVAFYAAEQARRFPAGP